MGVSVSPRQSLRIVKRFMTGCSLFDELHTPRLSDWASGQAGTGLLFSCSGVGDPLSSPLECPEDSWDISQL